MKVKISKTFKNAFLFHNKRYILCFLLFFSVTTFSKVQAQEIKKTAVYPINTTKITLRVKSLNDEQSARNLENIFKECGAKIVDYGININNHTATLIISDKLKPVDLLEVLESHGIHAGYLNEKKEYVTLEEDGELAEPISIDK